ncbi:hypothetical protein ACFO9Q_03310 [Paenibacillus sp. GCM10023252]|uniref:hypothetical protein n=1 Tax=Paenibacillus sp. GCM10023252 TaxID=3252649 RepID=UPI00361A3E9F
MMTNRRTFITRTLTTFTTRPCNTLVLLLLTITVTLTTLLSPISASASPLVITAATETAFTKMLGAADKQTADKLRNAHAELLTLQKQIDEWETRGTKLHYSNEEAIVLLRKDIKLIDAAKIAKLQAQVNQTKEKYKTLFAHYASLNQQLKVARLAKSKELTAYVNAQLDLTRIAVQLARQDIRSKEALLTAAKDSANKLIARIRATLEEVDPIYIQIKAEKSAASAATKLLTSEARYLGQVIKKGDTASTLHSFSLLTTYSKQISAKKTSIYNLELKITAIIARARIQVPPTS